jgi:S-DNA-T family DNA segregation ATPase FtsK/SpoIIIE
MELLSFLKSRRGGELAGIMILAAGVTTAAALLTYHPADSSAFLTSTKPEISNAIGYYGSTLAWVLIGFFGFASLLLPLGFMVWGWKLFWGHSLEYFHTKLVGFLILLVTLPPLFHLGLTDIWLRGALVPAGGYLGQEIAKGIAAKLNVFGSTLLLMTGAVMGLLLSTRMSLAAVFLWLKEWLAVFARGVGLRWARFTERQRKEKMKTSVVRKHLEKVEQEPDASPAPAKWGETKMAVREVKGRGKFQIRKVTKADLRKVAEELAVDRADPLELYNQPSDPELLMEPELPLLREPLVRRGPARKPKEPYRRRTEGIGLSSERLPFVNLLQPGPENTTIDEEVHRKFLDIGRLIEARCREFAVEGEVTAYHPGPVVTTFEFKPSAGVKYAKVVNLGDDLALALKAESIRIERISGSSTVGIEVPNRRRDPIALRDIVDTEDFQSSQSLLTLALGKDIHGDPVVTDLGRMPHLLVAGATGAGKSVGLNSMIISLLFKALPRQLRLILIDPKMVELKVYEDIPHLLHPIVTDPKLAANALIWAVQEMENRYRSLAECGVRNIDQYNAFLKDPEAHRLLRNEGAHGSASLEPMHYIVVVIDEFADLMMVASKEVEEAVARLAQKARAVGIHLIIATQRPSVDVITGVIKANFPSRISYRMASKVDSRTILDIQGAEKLLGNGDMLFLPPGTARIRRIHGAYASEREISEVVEFVKKNQGKPQFVEEVTQSQEEKSGIDGIEYLSDPKYDEAVRVVLSTGQASASYLQRRMKLGYSRAARLIEIMEANGIVGPSQGSKPREILIRADDYPGMDASSL